MRSKWTGLSLVMTLIFAMVFLLPVLDVTVKEAAGNGVLLPEVLTYHARDIDEDSASLRGVLTAEGDTTESGFFYDDRPGIDENDNIIIATNNDVNVGVIFKETLEGLEEGKTYYFRAYVKYIYGLEERTILADNTNSFTTGPFRFTDSDLEIVTGDAEIRDKDEATLNAYIEIDEDDWDDRKYEVYGCYFFYSTDENDVDDPRYLVQNAEQEIVYGGNYNDEDEELQFSVRLNNLDVGERYYFRAATEYKDDIGEGFFIFGDVEEFDLGDYSEVPEVTTKSASGINPDSATLNGEIVSAGTNDEITEYGFLYGTAAPPSIKVQVGDTGSNIDAGGKFEFKLSGLQPDTAYYFQSYAKNSAEIAYGKIESFTTGQVPVSLFTIGSPVYNLRGSIQIMDTAPYISNSRTYMPIRYAAYAMGLTDANIIWNEASKSVILTKDSNTVILLIGSSIMYVNSAAMQMDVAPEITDNRTCLPIAWVASAFGYTATWDGNAQTVTIR
jgi:hypothetical protein